MNTPTLPAHGVARHAGVLAIKPTISLASNSRGQPALPAEFVSNGGASFPTDGKIPASVAHDLQRPRGEHRSMAHWDVAFAQAAISGLFATVRTRHDAECSVGKVAAFLAEPQ
jgi:hypothetical protein